MIDQEQLKQRLLGSLERAATPVMERFLATMPPLYFQETDATTQLSHLTALVASAASGLTQGFTLTSEDGNTWTFLNEGSFPGLLADLVRRLPRDRSLTSARVHTSLDGRWVLDVFELGRRRPLEPDNPDLARWLAEGGPPGWEAHLRGCTPEYLASTSRQRLEGHFRLVERARRSGNVELEVEDYQGGGKAIRLCVQGEGRLMFERLSRYLGLCQRDIQRAHVTSFGSLRLLSFLIDETDDQLERDLVRLPYLDASVLELWKHTERKWSLLQAEVMVALLRLMHQKLAPSHPLSYSRERLFDLVRKHPDWSLSVVQAFLGKGPMLPGPADARLADSLRELLSACQHHNLDQPARRGLALKLDPGFLAEREPPHAVLFVHGRDFDGFHLRYQDVARGGMRLVTPRGPEQHTLESERLYEEAQGLARAQQLKNKDIPEGGAKAVVLVAPGARAASCAQAFTDCLLDLTLDTRELLYLGPDENVSDHLIEWVVERAELRGHPLPAAFMSSKPGAGINHKAYGITSEGVTVFLDVALRHLGFAPERDPFTVKLTGGPDGDVAGNEIKILLRDYPQTARVVGIADGSGSAEDPEGLCPEELLRLVEAGLPVAAFRKDQLSSMGVVRGLQDDEDFRCRNTLHNRVLSDAFIPAGGRPRTLNEDNWAEFLTREGRPSSPLVVEGANLFLTEEARHHLGREGVVIVKDSSANKCGVVCSSFEILASMLLSESEFLKLKERFVREVIERLRSLARAEADLLFQERALRPHRLLPDLSVMLSRVILEATEAIADAYEHLCQQDAELVDRQLHDYLPPVLQEVARERLHRIPASYRRRVAACSVASRMVYREGLVYLDGMAPAALAELSLRYLRSEREVRRLVASVESSQLQERERIAELLALGGTRAGTLSR